MLDRLDRTKPVQDGHGLGDSPLVTLAERLGSQDGPASHLPCAGGRSPVAFHHEPELWGRACRYGVRRTRLPQPVGELAGDHRQTVLAARDLQAASRLVGCPLVVAVPEEVLGASVRDHRQQGDVADPGGRLARLIQETQRTAVPSSALDAARDHEREHGVDAPEA